MPNALDLVYAMAAGALAPVMLLRPGQRAKVARTLAERTGDVPSRPRGAAGRDEAVLVHAVSLGEVNATRALIAALLAERPGLHVVLTTTTAAGLARARELFDADDRITVAGYPLDFSVCVIRCLGRLRPSVVVLMELEVWPNFIAECRRRGIPVILANGRLTGKSFARYHAARRAVKPMFAALHTVLVQEEVYRERFVALGTRPERTKVVGSMKFDTAPHGPDETAAAGLAGAMGLDRGHPVWVCGSTGPGEEAVLVRVYDHLLNRWPKLRLVLVPRKPERFDEVAELVKEMGHDLIRRSRPMLEAGQRVGAASGGPEPVVLVDTLGELRHAYALADVVFVGRSLVDLGASQHGSDMIEPAALGKPVAVGRYTTNFAGAVSALKSAGGVAEVADEAQLAEVLAGWLADESGRRAVGGRAAAAVAEGRGATARHVAAVLAALNGVPERSTAWPPEPPARPAVLAGHGLD